MICVSGVPGLKRHFSGAGPQIFYMIHRGGRTALYHSSSIIPVRRRAAYMYVILACTSSIVLQMHNHGRILHSILLFNGLRWQKGGGVGLSLDRKSTRFTDCPPLLSLASVAFLSSAHNVYASEMWLLCFLYNPKSLTQLSSTPVLTCSFCFPFVSTLVPLDFILVPWLQRLREGCMHHLLHASPGCHSQCLLQQILLSIVHCSACTQCSFRQSFILTLCSRFLGRGRHARELVQHSGWFA